MAFLESFQFLLLCYCKVLTTEFTFKELSILVRAGAINELAALEYDSIGVVFSNRKDTFVDLAVKVDDKILFLVEVKSIGTELKDAHLRQVVNYATKAGVDWAVLTNGAAWVIYLIRFAKPVSQERIAEFDILTLNTRKSSDLELLYILSAEGQKRSTLEDYHAFKKATSRYVISAILQEEAIIKAIRREVKRAFPEVKVDLETIKDTLLNEVLKREVVESEEAVTYKKIIAKHSKRALRSRATKKESDE